MRRRFHGIRRARSHQGFSLIEIVITLAVISVGLLAVVGLIPQGVQSARDAADNTLAATIVQDTFSTLRQQALESTFTWSSLSAIPDIYYDAGGTNSYSAASANTYYRVHFGTLYTANLVTIAATVMWPATASTVYPLNTNIFVTSIANYQH